MASTRRQPGERGHEPHGPSASTSSKSTFDANARRRRRPNDRPDRRVHPGEGVPGHTGGALALLDRSRRGDPLDAPSGLFGRLSARDNVTAVARPDDLDVDEFADECLGWRDLIELADVPAGELPYGLQRRLEIARALATRPRYLLLDEPAAGLNDVESADLEKRIRHIAKDSRFG